MKKKTTKITKKPQGSTLGQTGNPVLYVRGLANSKSATSTETLPSMYDPSVGYELIAMTGYECRIKNSSGTFVVHVAPSKLTMDQPQQQGNGNCTIKLTAELPVKPTRDWFVAITTLRLGFVWP